MSKYKKVEDKWAGVDWSKPNKEIAELMGCSANSVSIKRHALGKENERKLYLRGLYEKLDWSKSNSQLASETGEDCGRISYWRSKLAKPLVESAKNKQAREFFEGLDWTKRDCVLSQETGKPSSQLCFWRKKLGHSRGTGKTKHFGRWKLIDPTSIDFSKYDSELAVIHGVSRERIRQLRKQASLPSSKTIKKPTIGALSKITKDFNWNRPNCEIAKELCCCATYISTLRKLSGAAPSPKTRVYEKKYDYSNVDWSKSYAEISEELGCSIPTVYNYKKKLNLIGKKCRSTTAKTS